MPRRAAAAFIICEKPATEPPRFSATVVATSFADFTMMMRSAFSTVICEPAVKPILEAGSRAAFAETVSREFIDTRPWLTASSAT